MAWLKSEKHKTMEIVGGKDPDFELVDGDWCRKIKEEVIIDCDKLKDKKDLTKHEKFEKDICEHYQEEE